MTSLEAALKLKDEFGGAVTEPSEFRGEVTIELAGSERITDLCARAKESLGFNYLLDISSVDNLGSDPRWEVVYELYSMTDHCHLRLKTRVSEEKSELPTVCGIWRTADWHEREIYDMMGIRFRGHPDLRRIIMWDGYPYFPLRKDFPVIGKPTDLPDVAFTREAPIEGGPFVTAPGGADAIEREPRVRTPE
jgi:NADH-quinone oxidoreductase subunit C